MGNDNMKKYLTPFLLAILTLLFTCTGCSVEEISMPYGSADYKNGEWTVDSLVDHLEELGFSDIEVTNVFDSFGEERIEVYNVTIEDTSSDSWFTEYKAFKKGESYGTWLKIKIETHTFIPTLTTSNCSDFSELMAFEDSTEKNEAINSFMSAHNGEYIEFEGTITDWYDELFWVGIDFSISVEDSGTIFSWDTIDLIDTKLEGEYHYNKYKSGLISEGMRVHMIVKIVSTEDDWKLEIDAMEIVE